jgi:hypothetical protein
MISGSFEYGSEESLSNFKDHLKKHQLDIEVTMIIYESEDDEQSLQILESTDVMVLFTRRLNTKGKDKAFLYVFRKHFFCIELFFNDFNQPCSINLHNQSPQNLLK